MFFLLLLKEITSSSKAFLLVPAGLLGSGFVLLYIRHDVLKLFCSYLSPAVWLIPILFVFNPAVSRVVFNSHIESTYATSNARDIPVVMVVFDELPLTSLLDESAHIDSIRYPNFASLETDGHWFRNAHTVSSLTTVAVPAILSGVKKTNALPIVADHPQNLFTLLGQTHEMNVTEIVTSLCPDSACKKSTNLPLETN